MLNGSDSIRSKRSFERECAQDGVTIDSYHSDNGIFKANDFVEELQTGTLSASTTQALAHTTKTASQKAPSTSLETALGP